MEYRGGAFQFARRPAAMGRRGMVASANPLATLAGLRMLAAGGNAVDAAIATAVAVTVVEPYFSGLGGSGVAVLSLPNGETRVLNFIGRIPHGLHAEALTAKTRDIGPLAPVVPGNVAGWARLHSEYGRLPLVQVLEPAIELAEAGTPVTQFDYIRTTDAMDRLPMFPNAAQTYLNNGHPYAVGELLRQPGLAKTLRMVADEGWMTFYRGRIGHAVATYLAELGGVITEEDLQGYADVPRWETPLSARYRGYELRTLPPPIGAVQVLQTLRILEGFDLQNLDFLGPAHTAIVAEAIRLVRVDVVKYVAVPESVEGPLSWLLSDERVQEHRAEITHRLEAKGIATPQIGVHARAGRHPGPARIRRAKPVSERSTTHLAAADATGMAVNITQTLGSVYGSGVVIGDTGIVMNNLHRWCTFGPDGTFGAHGAPITSLHAFVDSPSSSAHSRRKSRLAFLVGTPGSYSIPQTTTQVVINLVDFGLNVQDAIAAPRFRWKDDVGDPIPPEVLILEGRFSNATRKTLAESGYPVEMVEDWSIRVGGAQGIVCREDGWMMGGADPRRNGYAMGW